MATEKSNHTEPIDRPIAVFDTNKGTFEAELYAGECPETVWNFINLAEGRQTTDRGGKFFDGLTFHRVIEGFVEAENKCTLAINDGHPIGIDR